MKPKKMSVAASKTKNIKSSIAIHSYITDVETMQLEVRLKLLDHNYAKLLGKSEQSYEELNELLLELRKIINCQEIERVSNLEIYLNSITGKVVQLKRSGNIIKGKPIQRRSGLGLAVQLMKRNRSILDDEAKIEEERSLQYRLEDLDQACENLLQNEKPDWLEMNNLLEELKDVAKIKNLHKVKCHEEYLEAIKEKLSVILDQRKIRVLC